MSIVERFKKFMATVKDNAQVVGANTGIAREFKDIFEIGGVPSFNEFYNYGILPWKMVYRGYYSAWHLIKAPTIADPNAKRKMSYLNLSKAVCAELAQMVWTDQSDISISTNGVVDGQKDVIAEFVGKVLAENNFNVKMLDAIEKAAALGGEALKVWYEVKHDSEGNEIPNSGRIRIGYCMADQFVPTAWDNAEISEGVFISRIAKDGYYYTRLEWHKWDALTYVITNELYRSEIKKNNTTEPQDILGYRYPLSSIYPYLNERTEINTIEKSLFSYFHTPVANNLDDNSPLGVSVYANAMETLHALDIAFDSFVREFRLGKKRIIVPARMIKTVVDPITGKSVRYFDATDETYEALSTDDPDSLKIQDNSVELRVDEHVAGINAFLNIFCLQIGLSAGTFSFDAKSGLKTATEVVSENSKTYKTVKNFQNMLVPAITRLVDNIIEVAALYGLEYEGKSIAAEKEKGYDVSVILDDGITQDRQTNINEGMALVNARLMSKKKFLTDPKFGQGLTEEEAEAELKQIAAESQVTGFTIDKMNMDTAE
ncbi:MAG: phage portal protein [Clostridiales bacterium]|nr:phage portal protein [Clostridiales bacterium]